MDAKRLIITKTILKIATLFDDEKFLLCTEPSLRQTLKIIDKIILIKFRAIRPISIIKRA